MELLEYGKEYDGVLYPNLTDIKRWYVEYEYNDLSYGIKNKLHPKFVFIAPTDEEVDLGILHIPTYISDSQLLITDIRPYIKGVVHPSEDITSFVSKKSSANYIIDSAILIHAWINDDFSQYYKSIIKLLSTLYSNKMSEQLGLDSNDREAYENAFSIALFKTIYGEDISPILLEKETRNLEADEITDMLKEIKDLDMLDSVVEIIKGRDLSYRAYVKKDAIKSILNTMVNINFKYAWEAGYTNPIYALATVYSITTNSFFKRTFTYTKVNAIKDYVDYKDLEKHMKNIIKHYK